MLNKQVKIYESNILNFFEDYFSKKISNKIIICGNIPYNLSSYILSNLVKFQAFIPAAIFLLPKEITDILLFTPSKKIYKTITSKYTVIPLLKIHNQAFFPKPKVTSILVKFISK